MSRVQLVMVTLFLGSSVHHAKHPLWLVWEIRRCTQCSCHWKTSLTVFISRPHPIHSLSVAIFQLPSGSMFPMKLLPSSLPISIMYALILSQKISRWQKHVVPNSLTPWGIYECVIHLSPHGFVIYQSSTCKHASSTTGHLSLSSKMLSRRQTPP